MFGCTTRPYTLNADCACEPVRGTRRRRPVDDTGTEVAQRRRSCLERRPSRDDIVDHEHASTRRNPTAATYLRPGPPTDAVALRLRGASGTHEEPPARQPSPRRDRSGQQLRLVEATARSGCTRCRSPGDEIDLRKDRCQLIGDHGDGTGPPTVFESTDEIGGRPLVRPECGERSERHCVDRRQPV